MKSDPTRIQIRDLRDSTYDDLARALRLKLKNMKSISEGITAVFSNEVATRKLLPLKEYFSIIKLAIKKKTLMIIDHSKIIG